MDSLKAPALSSLIEAITELVIKELETAGYRSGNAALVGACSGPASAGIPQASPAKGPRLLVVPGPEPVPEAIWAAFAGAKIRPSALIWNGFRQDQLPAPVAGWPLEARGTGWSKVVSDYSALCLLGSDLPTLGSLASLGAGGLPPAGVAVAAVAAGMPVFCESGIYEKVRRHSARLAPGFVRTFEESWRTATSFGVEFGTAPELKAFLSNLGPTGASKVAASKGGGRDVVTSEDVEAAKRAGQTQLLVGMGSIVTPLALQQAGDWGIEVKFQ